MRVIRSIVAVVVTFTLGCSLFACSQSQNPVAKKSEIDISVMVPTLSMVLPGDEQGTGSAYDFLKIAAEQFSESYEQADVTIKVTEFDLAKETEAIGDTLGTQQAPDVLYEGYFNMGTYIHSGYVVPLDDIISEEIRADIPESFWEISQVNGKTYMMPFLHTQNTLSFNKQLLDEAGLSQYTQGAENNVMTWTLEEWDAILKTLRENLPDTSYPMMMYAADEQGDTHIMTLLRAFGSDFYDEYGRFHLNTPEGIAALQWIKDNYDAGYYPQGADTLTITDNYKLYTNGMLAIYMSNPAQDPNLRAEGGFEPMSVNFPYTDGGLATTFVVGFEVFDNGDPEKVRVAKDFVKYIYESDLLDYSASSAPVSNRVAAAYANDLQDIQKYINNSDAIWNFTNNHPNWRGVREVFYTHIQDLLFGSVTAEEAAAAIDADCNAAIEEGYATSKLHE